MIKQSETMEADDIIETGYYQGGGYLYEHGVKPACTFCGSTELPIFATNTSGINICKDDPCAVVYAHTQHEKIEHIDDGKLRCTICETVSQYNQNTWDGDVCPECLKEE